MSSVKYLIVGMLVWFVGCNDGSVVGSNDNGVVTDDNISLIDDQLSKIIKTRSLTGDPSTSLTIPLISSAKAQLGMKLFFSKALSGDKDTACVTCHHPALGGGDNLSLPIGVAALNPDILGSGRKLDLSATQYSDGYVLVPRNSPSIYNIALWKRGLFWDGRVEKVINNGIVGVRTPDSEFGEVDINATTNLVTAQARFPLVSHEEMRGFVFEVGSSNDEVRTHLAKRLSDSNLSDYIPNSWQDEFTPVYGENSITFSNIMDAISEYERSGLFVNSPWKNYVKGDKEAISESAKRGAKLFFSSYGDGGFSCATCHSGDFFTDENYHVMAIPQIGSGKNVNNEDFGRFNESGVKKYAFKTPTLLNVEVTGPWGHSGAYTTLEGIVRHMVDPQSAVEEYDITQLNQPIMTNNTVSNTAKVLTKLQADRALGISVHKSSIATDENIADLVEFLKSLTDPCVKDRECIGKWIPDNVSGPDGLQLNALDANGSLL